MNKPSIPENLSLWSAISLLMVSVVFVGSLSNDIYLPSMTELVGVFSVSENLIQATFTAWFAGSVAFQLFFGPFSDRFGRKPLFFGSGLLMVIASLLCVISDTFSIFFIGRVLQGVAFSGLLIAIYASVHELFKDAHRATKMFALIGICASLSPIIGPVVGGYIYTWISWEANFYLVSCLVALALVGLWRIMPEPNQNLDLQALNFKRLRANYVRVIKNTDFLFPTLSSALILAAIIAYITAIAFVVIEYYGLEPTLLGYTLIPPMAAYIIGATLSGKLSARIPSKYLAFAGLVMSFLGAVWMLVVSLQFSEYFFLFLLSITFIEFGYGLCNPVLSNMAMLVFTESKGSASAMLTFCSMIGATFGSVLMSTTYNNTLFPLTVILLTLTGLALLSYLAVIFSKDAPPRSPQ